MSDRVILGVDPGQTTGIAVVRWSDAGLELLESWEEPDWLKAASQIRQRMKSATDVATEDFVILKKTKGQWSIKLNGIVEHSAWENGVVVHGQNSQRAKAFATNQKLRALGLWHVGGGGHAKDAIRHVLLMAVIEGFSDRRMVQ